MRRGIVAIRQHCDMNASVRCRRTSGPSAHTIAGMTSADTSAASFDPSFAESKGWSLRRFAGAVRGRPRAAVGLPDLRGAHRPDPDRADPRSRHFLPADQCARPSWCWSASSSAKSGRWCRPAAAAGRRRRLHVQIVSLFSVIAVLPAVLVAIVANVTIDRGLDRLFSGPTREVIQNSLIVARAYLHEHAQLIRGDILGMANDIAHARPLYDQDRGTFRELLTASAASRNLPGAMLIDKDRNILETAQTGIQQSFHDAAAGIPRAMSTRPSPRSRYSPRPTTSRP